ncbi:MAG: response regulator [Myxococcales bacterium]|nr:MAG: response regulator [Myxococcales bacterium]
MTSPDRPPGHRILVVDDSEDGADMLAELLRRQGHDLRTAYDGESALEIASAFHPEVVFLALELSGIDGHEVARQLRAAPALAGVFLIALTGRGSEADIQRSREVGIDVHLTKPVAPRELLAVLARHTSRPAT